MPDLDITVKPSVLARTKSVITRNAKPAAAIAAVGVVVYVLANKFLGETDEPVIETEIDI